MSTISSAACPTCLCEKLMFETYGPAESFHLKVRWLPKDCNRKHMTKEMKLRIVNAVKKHAHHFPLLVHVAIRKTMQEERVKLKVSERRNKAVPKLFATKEFIVIFYSDNYK